ncbi:hypothetical protein I0Q12_02650 [Rhodococcus sp. CX]|uniref:hypothetical protein n=1 Tax=Rhodococcus sp. CX TaxID=2789880 RepID=UPI0018CEC361|nr:hypothetical protein [Rhodococcus sp. CX]MBH0118496.1 hypothetical protein [Rhodococcus sp. CX]
MSHPVIVEHSSIAAAEPTDVWTRITDPAGINDELSPLLAMRMPRRMRGTTVDRVPVGEPLGKAPLLLFGVLPVDYDALTIAELEPGRRFHEKSTMLTMHRWEHERTLTAAGPGRTRVHDRLTMELRAPLARLPYGHELARRIVTGLFEHRHRRLARHFAGVVCS